MERSDLKIGDHIYTPRTMHGMETYKHHGICVENGRVIHFVQDGVKTSRGSSVRRPNKPKNSSSDKAPQAIRRSHCPHQDPECGIHSPPGNSSGCVVIYCLDCFLENGSLHCYEYGVSKEKFERNEQSSTVKSDPPEEVLRRAKDLLRNNIFGEYDLLENSSEDFSVYCKTGLLQHERDPRHFHCQVPNPTRFVGPVLGYPR